MNTAKQATWLCAALIALSGFCWYGASTTVPRVSLSAQTLATTPDQRITTLTVQKFDETGRLTHQLTTPYMHHLPAQNQHWLKTPSILVTAANQPTWRIQSQEATSILGGERITFQHHVLIHHDAYQTNQAGTILTDELSYIPKQKIATTEAKIRWTQAGNAVHATGMNAYLDERRIDLLHQARATYEPMHG